MKAPVTGRVWQQCGVGWLWLVCDCVADTSGGLTRFGGPQPAQVLWSLQVRPGVTTAPPAPTRLIAANYINHRRENSNPAPPACERGGQPWGRKSKEGGPTCCHTIPSRPHHIRFLTTSPNIIGISLHPQNLNPLQPNSNLLPTTASRCNQYSPPSQYTYIARHHPRR